MKGWRPDDWEETKQIGDDVLNNEDYLDKLYEAGADAILEAQEKLGFQMPTLVEKPKK